MKLSDLFPPGDLLRQVEGIESGLLQRQRLSVAGLSAALLQIVILIANNAWFEQFLAGDWMSLVQQHWLSLGILAGVVLSLLLAGWARFWIKESQAPFRYTYSIADFKAVLGEKGEGGSEHTLSFHLSHDLAQRLNDRIKRLSLLDDERVKASTETQANLPTSQRRSHIHIKGHYIIRQRPSGEWFIEVLPRIRIGSPDAPETLAHAVKFKLLSGADDSDTSAPPLSAKEYEQIVERVYFSVATEIYKQIRKDVEQKIALLPNDYYRAVAFFFEAEDYARSNTLDAYDEALQLYEEAFKAFDPSLRPLYTLPFPRAFQRLYHLVSRGWSAVKRWLARVFPRLGKVELLCAKAEIGYASMLLYRRILASIASRRINPVFEARPIAKRAVDRLERLSEDVSGQRQTQFDAYVTYALAWQFLGSSRSAEDYLNQALHLFPARAERDAKYVFVAGGCATDRTEKLQRYRRAIEIDAQFDVAHFSIAAELEMDWRERTNLERGTAEMVIREYLEVLQINRGNVGAWANIGYIHWLLGDNTMARTAFEEGREYKEIQRETYVAELDCGLARIAADEGNFEAAYQYFDTSISTVLAQGIAYSPDGQTGEFYYYDFISPAILQRFEKYKSAVESNRRLWETENAEDISWQELAAGLKARVIAELTGTVQQQSRKTAECLAGFLQCVAMQVNKSERDKLAEQVGSLPIDEAIKNWLKGGNLASLAAHMAMMRLEQWEGAPGDDLVQLLLSTAFSDLMCTRVPTRRVKDAVYAFVLDDYGNACNKYYMRYGDARLKERATRAYQDAINKKEDFVLPYFHFYINISKEKQLLERVNALVPNWPDGKLARIALLDDELQARRHALEAAQDKAKQTEEEAQKLNAEIVSLEDTLKTKRETIRARGDRAAELPHLPSVGPSLRSREDQGAHKGTISKDDSANTTFVIHPEVLHLEEKIAEYRQNMQTLRGTLTASGTKIAEQDRELILSEDTVESEITKDLRSLLPVEWLWTCDGGDGQVRLDIYAFYPSNDKNDLRWEKEINSLQARALYTWSALKLRRAARREASPKERAEAIIVFCSLIDHFWPEDFNLLDTYRLLAPELNETRIEATIRSSIASWLPGDRMIIHNAYRLLAPELNETRIEATIRSSIASWLPSDPYLAMEWIIHDTSFNAADRKCYYRRFVQAESLSSNFYILLGKQLLKAGDDDKALEAFRKAKRACSSEHPNRNITADIHLNLGRTLLIFNDKEAIDAFITYGQGAPDPWRGPLVSQVLDSVQSAESYRLMQGWLERELETCLSRHDDSGLQDAQEALRLLRRERYLTVMAVSASANVRLVVTPIAIEADATLFPYQAAEAHLDKVRQRIEEKMGVHIADNIRLQQNTEDFLKDSYIIMLHEVPLVLGKVEKSRWFCPRYKEILPHACGSSNVFNPQTGEMDGAWIEESQVEGAEQAGAKLCDHVEYAAQHLEEVLMTDLTPFLGLQEVGKLLEQWRTADGDTAAGRRQLLIAEAMPDLASRIRFVQVLQGLVKERIPITNLYAILTAYKEPDMQSHDVSETIESVRLWLKGELPGNNDAAEFLYLSEAFEKEVARWLRRHDGKLYLAIPPDEVQALLTAFRDGVADRSRRQLVVVTRTEGIRPFVRRLIELEFPRVNVLSWPELRPVLRPRVTETIAYNG